MNNDLLLESIAQKVKQGELDGQKMAVGHTQVLLHADQLADINLKDFCARIGMRESFGVEIYKMRRVAKMLKDLGYRIDK